MDSSNAECNQNLPYEIVEDLLTKTDPTTICRFRSTSQDWKQSLDEADFVMRHKAEMRKKNDVGIILQRELYFSGLEYMRIDRYPGYRMTSNYRFRIHLSAYDCFVLICEDEYGLFVENPTLRKDFSLPFDRISIPNGSNGCTCYFGLGYDREANDFYVVKISCFMGWNMGNEVKMYTRSTNEWVTMANFPYIDSPERSLSWFVNGSFHWVVDGGALAVLTVSTGAWTRIEKPSNIGPFERFDQLVCFDCSTLVLYQTTHLYGEQLKIYILEAYAGSNTWRRISVPIVLPMRLLNMITMQPLYVIEQKRDRIYFRCNPLDCYGYLDLQNGSFVWTSDVPLYRFSATAIPYHKSLECLE